MAANSNEIVIGIDVGGTNTKFGLVDSVGNILDEGRIKTTEYATVELFVEALYENISPLLKTHSDKTVKGIGMGAPNGNFYTGCIDHAPNLPWGKDEVPLAKLMSDKFDLTCILTNDANAAAAGEMQYGIAKGMQHFIEITLGTGVGSGIVVDGKLLYGCNGIAGELGHTIIRPGGRKHWSTGSRGSVEAYCSATGIVITAKEQLKKKAYPDSKLRQVDVDSITAKVINECALQGDKLAQKVYHITGRILGEALANFVMFSSPQAIVLFGGVIKAGDYLLKPAKKYMELNLLPAFRGRVKILLSDLREADAAILGASSLVQKSKATKAVHPV